MKGLLLNSSPGSPSGKVSGSFPVFAFNKYSSTAVLIALLCVPERVETENILPLIKEADLVISDKSAVRYEVLGLDTELEMTYKSGDSIDIEAAFYKRDGKATERALEEIRKCLE